MKFLLRFVAIYNLSAGLMMVFGHSATYALLGIGQPESNFPIQLVGVLVGLFGVGYYWVARDPLANRNVLLLGLLSKTLGSIVGLCHVATGGLPPRFLILLFFSDVMYLPPFWLIYQHLEKVAADRAAKSSEIAAPPPSHRNEG